MPAMNDKECISRKLEIKNIRGLHARASASFVKCASKFDAEIEVLYNGYTVPGTSIMGLMMLAAHKGTVINVTACGPDAQIALDALEELLGAAFNED